MVLGVWMSLREPGMAGWKVMKGDSCYIDGMSVLSINPVGDGIK
jgi:hypothetical protein